ncbi:MAG TPA: hypothetical protein VMH85_06690 [Terriglobales bacterium]|nr:hypothetical protein [Terriglobales bacterium]
MGNTTFLSWMRSGALAGLLLLVPAAIPAFSETLSPQSTEVHNQLKDFRNQAFALRKEASTLKSYTRGRLNWLSHADRLNNMREHVNELGQRLQALEQAKVVGTGSHQMAIENARPHLAATARQLTEAIELLNESHGRLQMLPYTETVSDLYEHTHSLYQTVDTILDYENARVRLDKLDLPASADQS